MTLEDDAPTRVWIWRGMVHLVSIHSLVLMGAQVGFAALCRELGVTLGEAIALTLFVWALPSQVIYIGLASAGASFPAIVVAVSLSALRFLPMVMTWTPLVRGPTTRPVSLYLMAMFVTITSWVFAVSRLPQVPRAGRVPFFAAFSVGLSVVNAVIVGLAYALVSVLPPMVGALLAFLMPIYFLLALVEAAKIRIDAFALAAGMLGLPLATQLAPDMDILIAGVAGGAIAYGLGRLVHGPRAA